MVRGLGEVVGERGRWLEEVVGGGGRSKGEGGFESMVLVGITSIVSV